MELSREVWNSLERAPRVAIYGEREVVLRSIKSGSQFEWLLVANFGNQEWHHLERVLENSRCVGVHEWVCVCVCVWSCPRCLSDVG